MFEEGLRGGTNPLSTGNTSAGINHGRTVSQTGHPTPTRCQGAPLNPIAENTYESPSTLPLRASSNQTLRQANQGCKNIDLSSPSNLRGTLGRSSSLSDIQTQHGPLLSSLIRDPAKSNRLGSTFIIDNGRINNRGSYVSMSSSKYSSQSGQSSQLILKSPGSQPLPAPPTIPQTAGHFKTYQSFKQQVAAGIVNSRASSGIFLGGSEGI